MKIIPLIPLAAIGLVFNLNAQYLNTEFMPAMQPSLEVYNSPTSHQINKSSQQLNSIFVETFGNGLTGDNIGMSWISYGSPLPGCVWEYRGTNTTPNNTTGSRGAYTGTSGVIGSPTASNGFFIFDSDYYDNNGIQGNFGNGPFPAPHISYLESPTIDLSAQNAPPILEFNSYFRRFQANGSVEFSGDNGVTWNESIILYDANSLNSNQSNNSSHTEIIYIPSSVANSATFKFRFKFDGDTEADGYYFWQVDDIRLSEAPDNDLELVETFFADSGDVTQTMHFHHVPELISTLDTLTFFTYYSNNGNANQPNTVISVDVTGQQTANLATAAFTSAGGSGLDSTLIPGYFVPTAGVGDYNIDVAITSDSIDYSPGDNSESFFYQVTENFYSLFLQGNPTTSTFWEEDEQIMRVEYPMWDTAEVTAVGVAIGDWGTKVGSLVSFQVSDFSNGGFNVVAENAYYSLTANDIGQGLVYYPVPKTKVDPSFLYVGLHSFVVGDTLSFDVDATMDAPQSRVFIEIGGTNYYTTRIPNIALKVYNEDLCDSNAAITFDIDDDPQVGSITVTSVTGTEGMLLYSWRKDDIGFTSSSKDLTGLFEPGYYTLTVQDINGCEVTETAYINPVSTEEAEVFTADLSIYPNPTTGEVSVKLDRYIAGEYTITVTNVMGQVVMTETANLTTSESVHTLNLNNFKKGVYLIAVDNGSNQIVERVILK